ncbi:MAG: CdaR family protein [Clostridia bacterium]|nr:CdaR family protein [Clostridia bacterium]MDH7572058.1 CdaR family protein [Clostridia bacterium]
MAVEALRRSDWGYKLIALALAFALWLYVTEERNPVADNVLNVPLETRAVPSDLVVAEKPTTVQVRVQGARQAVERLTPRDLQAFVNLSGAHAGANQRPVEVVLPSRVELVEVLPPQASVVLEQVTKTQLPVEVKLTGEPAPGYEVLAPLVRPQEVVVSGPRSWLEELAKGVVEVNIRGRTESLHLYLPVRLIERDGEEALPGPEVDPSAVEVFVPVAVAGVSKEVPVKVALEGDPAEGYKLGRIAVSPSTVRVYGAPEVLAGIKELVSRPVNISGARESLQVLLDFSPPEGLYLYPVAVAAVIEVLPDRNREPEAT